MSWETLNESKKACPCGNGTYTIIQRMDDWNRLDSNWVMNCPECMAIYSLYSYNYYDSGIPTQGKRWVKKGAFEKSKKLQQEADKLKEKAVELAREKYFPLLIDKFSKSSKKEIWSVLNENIAWYKSLGTFYKHTKNRTTKDYLSDVFDYRNLKSILKIVNIKDTEISDSLLKIDSLESEARDQLYS